MQMARLRCVMAPAVSGGNDNRQCGPRAAGTWRRLMRTASSRPPLRRQRGDDQRAVRLARGEQVHACGEVRRGGRWGASCAVSPSSKREQRLACRATSGGCRGHEWRGAASRNAHRGDEGGCKQRRDDLPRHGGAHAHCCSIRTCSVHGAGPCRVSIGSDSVASRVRHAGQARGVPVTSRWRSRARAVAARGTSIARRSAIAVHARVEVSGPERRRRAPRVGPCQRDGNR